MAMEKGEEGECYLVVWCIVVGVLILKLNCGFIWCLHWRKLGKAYLGSLYYFLQLRVNAQLFQSKYFHKNQLHWVIVYTQWNASLNVCNLLSFEKCIQLCENYHNQDAEHFTLLSVFLMSICTLLYPSQILAIYPLSLYITFPGVTIFTFKLHVAISVEISDIIFNNK